MTIYASGELLSKLFGPFLVRRINIPASVVTSCFIWIVSWLLVVIGEDEKIRLAGSFAIGIVTGLFTTIGMSLLSFYDEIERNASAYIAGMNAATFLAGCLYTGEFR